MAEDNRPHLWILDSDRKPLAEAMDVFSEWADIQYVGPGEAEPTWEEPPDAIFFSAEIAGGPGGPAFAELRRQAGGVPLLTVARLRSLAQAVAFFRAGVTDYLSFPLDEDDVRERFEAAMEKATQQAMEGLLVELEPVDGDVGEVRLSARPYFEPPAVSDEEDILAHLNNSDDDDVPALLEPGGDTLSRDDDATEAAPPQEQEEEEPEAVDGLPIPTLWEELPCGLLVFDSQGNLVFSNSLGLDLFGLSSIAELEEALENNRSRFDAHGANHKPLPDNQWPQVLALKARTTRSAVVSIEKPDKRRVWLRIDCLPHVVEGKINRLSMTLVNLTGELPPLAASPAASSAPAKKEKGKSRSKRRK